jgi:hypothetical protein
LNFEGPFHSNMMKVFTRPTSASDFFYPFLDATSIVKLHVKLTRSERLRTVTRTEEKRDIAPFCQLMGCKKKNQMSFWICFLAHYFCQ